MEAEEEIKRVFRVGGSLVFAIPKRYIEAHNVEAGDQIRVLYNEFLHAKPIDREKLAEKLEKAKETLEK